MRFCTGYANPDPKIQSFAQQVDISLNNERAKLAPQISRFLAAGQPGLPRSFLSVKIDAFDLANLGAMKPDPAKKVDAAEIETAEGTRYVAVSVSNDRVVALQPLPIMTLANAYGISRQFAAYVVLNELLASDAALPRQGCIRLFDVWFADTPGVLPELKSAIMRSPPQPNITHEKLLMAAYRDFSRSKQNASNPLTHAALTLLGRSPTITEVYTDADTTLSMGLTIGVVRMSKGSARTYATFAIFGKRASLSSPALCVTGDLRCAQYYGWP